MEGKVLFSDKQKWFISVSKFHEAKTQRITFLMKYEWLKIVFQNFNDKSYFHILQNINILSTGNTLERMYNLLWDLIL